MTDDSMWKAVHRMEATADSVSRAADRMEEAARRIAHLLEDGYGGNGLRLIELLEGDKGQEKAKAEAQDFWAEAKCEICGMPAVTQVFDLLQYADGPSGMVKVKHYGQPHLFCRVHTRESYRVKMGPIYPPPQSGANNG